MEERFQKVIDEWNETADSEESAFHHTDWEVIHNAFPFLRGKKYVFHPVGIIVQFSQLLL